MINKDNFIYFLVHYPRLQRIDYEFIIKDNANL